MRKATNRIREVRCEQYCHEDSRTHGPKCLESASVCSLHLLTRTRQSIAPHLQFRSHHWDSRLLVLPDFSPRPSDTDVAGAGLAVTAISVSVFYEAALRAVAPADVVIVSDA